MTEHTSWHITATRRWSIWLLGCLSVLLALAFSGCDGGSDDGSNVPTATLLPGDTFTLGISETLTVSGTYLLPGGATTLTTRCTGDVSVTFETVPGMPQTNTCDSPDESTSITNIVTGASSVTYDFGAGASAQVTARE